jgi:hypothetical protein
VLSIAVFQFGSSLAFLWRCLFSKCRRLRHNHLVGPLLLPPLASAPCSMLARKPCRLLGNLTPTKPSPCPFHSPSPSTFPLSSTTVTDLLALCTSQLPNSTLLHSSFRRISCWISCSLCHLLQSSASCSASAGSARVSVVAYGQVVRIAVSGVSI